MQYLNQDRILEIVSAFTAAGMVRQATLDSLIENIDPAYTIILPEGSEPLPRLIKTLGVLNRTERLVDGTVPFQIWLKNAVPFAAARPEALKVINRALDEVSAGFAGVRPRPDFKTKLPSQNERIVHEDDMLPFSFLKRGTEVGGAVARLAVSRFDGGAPTKRPNGDPVRFLGTGWLLTRDLLITNHHVINAREDGEPNASQADFDLQARSVEVQFDYDGPGSAFAVETVSKLEASATFEGPLDYAIVRLAREVERQPLSIVKGVMQAPAIGARYPAVNIIQHPEGSPKKVACRNNLVARVDGIQLIYFTDTMSGSSGSPVFDDQWRVVALHKKWKFVEGVSYQGKDTAWANVGTQIQAILDDLRSSGKEELLAEILAANA